MLEMPTTENVGTSSLNSRLHTRSENKVFYVNVYPEPVDISFRYIEVLGSFSLDSERNFRADFSQLKYLKLPPYVESVGFDLRYRMRDVISKTSDEKLDNLLKWILNDNRIWKSAGTTQVAESERTSVDFVSYRGLLSKLLSTPYENFDGWIICASRWKGTIYLCAKETAEQQRKREQQTEEQKKYMTWGRKFEQYMLADTVDGVPNVNRPIDENEEFCVVFGSKVHGYNMLYGAEVDGVHSTTQINSYKDLRKAKFVELKTHRTITKRGHENIFKKFKLRSVWCQVAPVAIDHVVFGHRCDNGIVRYLGEYDMDNILDESQTFENSVYCLDKTDSTTGEPRVSLFFTVFKQLILLSAEQLVLDWQPETCMKFLNRFLEAVKTSVRQDLPDNCPDSVIKFEWKLGNSKVRADVIIGQSEYSFLPKWYTDNFKHSLQIVKHE